MRTPLVVCLGLVEFACRPPAPAPAPLVAVVEEDGANGAPAPGKSAEALASIPSGYLTRDHGCAKLDAAVAEGLLKEGNEAIERAGEHPSPADLEEILPKLHRAAYGGYEPAQRRYGYYVVGYWYTDEMFWPRSEAIAVSALAMLRVSAKHEGATNGGVYSDPLLKAVASDPVTFSEEEGPPSLPEEWVNAGVEEADHWLRCVQGK